MITIKLMLIFIVFVNTNSLDCRDEENNIVDWFIVYKLPILRHNREPINEGLAYIYLTSNDETWKLSSLNISAQNSIIADTLSSLYSNKENASFILYNDESPDGRVSSTKGHTKGVVAADKNGGFWLVHSVPKFPDINNEYIYPNTGVIYGQTFLCISLNLENINKVGVQLQYNQPNIYKQNISPDLKESIPELVRAANNVTIKTSPWYHGCDLYSKSNVKFLSFAKASQFRKELYVDLVAPVLQSDLLVETWSKGSGKLHSNCSQQFRVYNVKSIKMSVANISFTSTDDHSKWAVSSRESGKNWSCVGDINREEHQKYRGGGTLCINDTKVTQALQNLVLTIEDC